MFGKLPIKVTIKTTFLQVYYTKARCFNIENKSTLFYSAKKE